MPIYGTVTGTMNTFDTDKNEMALEVNATVTTHKYRGLTQDDLTASLARTNTFLTEDGVVTRVRPQ